MHPRYISLVLLLLLLSPTMLPIIYKPSSNQSILISTSLPTYGVNSKSRISESSDDWVITGSEYISNQEIILNKSLKVVGTASLTLENVTLIFNPQINVGIGLEVLNDSQLVLKNVTICSKTNLLSYYIYINTSGTVLIKNSDISRVGSPHANTSRNGFFVEDVAGLVIENSSLHEIYSGLHIKNSENIKIQDNRIFLGFSYGLTFVNCSNVQIARNELTYNHNLSVYFVNSSKIFVLNNNISSSYYGIYGMGSSEITITTNNISYCSIGVYLSSSMGVDLDSNLFVQNKKSSIDISDTQGVIERNNIYNSSIYVHGSKEYLQNLTISSSNKINNNPVYYGFNLSNASIENSTYGQVILVYSTQVILQNIHANTLEIYACENISAEALMIGYNIQTGIHIEDSNVVTLRSLNVSNTNIGLDITNSSNILVEYAEIKNCSFAGVYIVQTYSLSLYNILLTDSEYGIFSVTSSEINLSRIHVLRNYNPIKFMYTSNGIIENSDIEYASLNGKGIHMLYSNNVLIRNNTLRNCYNNIYLWRSNNTHVVNNTLLTSYSFGLVIDRCLNTSLSGTQIKNSSIFVIGGIETFRTLTMPDNATENEYNILIVFNKTNLSFVHLHLDYLLLAYCENISIQNSTVKSIQIYFSKHISINRTIIATPTTYGIYVEKSNNTIIANNTIRDKSGYGLYVYKSWNTVVFRNLICNNTLGIYLYAYQTLIYQNAFIENNVHAQDLGVSRWDDGLVGNYWSDVMLWANDSNRDGVLDASYTIPGRGALANDDTYPLAFPLLDYDYNPPKLISFSLTKWETHPVLSNPVRGITVVINATDEHPIRLIEISIVYKRSGTHIYTVNATATYDSKSELYVFVDDGCIASAVWSANSVNVTILLIDIYENKVIYSFTNYTVNINPNYQGEANSEGDVLTMIAFFVLLLVVCLIPIFVYILRKRKRKKTEILPDYIVLKVPTKK